jgi:prepilin-type N-terminal cleavage/methylation domain-containing protein
MRRPASRGLTLIELMVVIAIVGIMSVIAFDALRRSRPRASFQGATAELQSLVHLARQEALSRGLNVAVLVFPSYVTPTGTGRIIVVADDTNVDLSLFSDAAFNFAAYDPSVVRSTANGWVIGTLDLPKDVLVGPVGGAGVASLPFPYDNITLNQACSFCGTDGGARGAIVFDRRGRATFRSVSGTAVQDSGQTGGASLSLYSTQLGTGTRNSVCTLVITRPQGMLRSIYNG